MVNMMEWMCTLFAPNLLSRHFVGKSRGESKGILQALVGGQHYTFPMIWFHITRDTLAKDGPVLVSRFAIQDSFEEEGKYTYSDQDVPNDKHLANKGISTCFFLLSCY
jgi:hypothetical protein